jgi:hypothetical protein
MNPARKAAAQLAALGKRDRAWVWSRLDSTERRKIKPLLDELVRLPSGTLTAELQKLRTNAPSPVSVRRSEVSDLASLRHTSTKEIIPLVSALPAASIALLLQIENWRWSEDLLKSLDVDQRKIVKELLANGGSDYNKVLADWLVSQLASRIRSERARGSMPDKRFDVLVDLVD